MSVESRSGKIQNSGLSGGMSVESRSGKIQNSGLSSGVGSRAGESSGGGDVAPEELLLGPDDLLRSGDVGDLEEAGGGVTVGIVGARGSSEASGQLGGGRDQCQGGEREDSGHHLDCCFVETGTVAQSIFTDS